MQTPGVNANAAFAGVKVIWRYPFPFRASVECHADLDLHCRSRIAVSLPDGARYAVLSQVEKILPITPTLALNPDELDISYIRASGPGGQNVNKVSSAAQLRFDLLGSPSLSGAVKARAAKLAGSRLTLDGVIVITAQEHRTQNLNREAAIARLLELLAKAATPPKPRRATRPTLGSKVRRLDSKTRRGGIKSLRGEKPGLE